ncbi:MAG: hypothetical protein AAF513_06240 [Pseudomonadota bacterium]
MNFFLVNPLYQPYCDRPWFKQLAYEHLGVDVDEQWCNALSA